MRAEGQRKPFDPKSEKLISSCRGSVEHYSNEPTDTASSGTSSELKEAHCNSAEEKLDREVSLRVAAKRR